jgi:hypothetical protein
MRFQRSSALDLLADALRRADATWHGDLIHEWDALPEFVKREWRARAREAAKAVCEEVSEERERVAAD